MERQGPQPVQRAEEVTGFNNASSQERISDRQQHPTAEQTGFQHTFYALQEGFNLNGAFDPDMFDRY